MGRNWPSASSCQLSVGVEFEASTRMQDTSVSFGYQLDVPKANLQFKGKGCFLLSWQITLPQGVLTIFIYIIYFDLKNYLQN